MHRTHPSGPDGLRSLALSLAVLAGSLGSSDSAAVDTEMGPGKRQYRQILDGPLVVEYELETRRSAIDGKSCYSFLNGTLANHALQRLSRYTELHFHIYHGDDLLFSERSRLRADLSPGDHVQFEFIESPLHKKHCPSYDRIDVTLKQIVLP